MSTGQSEPIPAAQPGSTCGACEGTTVSTPRVVDNRPGLTGLAYRSGVHGDFLASMLAGLSRRSRPALAGLRTRDPDDPTIALLDAWAAVCDVLTFYTERLAEESYLRTARERTSLQELGKLVAYRLDPGAAAETHLAFTLERPPALPALDPPDPGLLPPAVPASVVLPARLRVQSVPGPGEAPQLFETVEEVEARPEWSSLPVVRTRPHLPTMGRVDAWLEGTGLALARGAPLLLASDDLVNDRWDVRLLTEVREHATEGVTHVRWKPGLGSWNPFNRPADVPAAYVLRRRLSVFGHNAPVWSAMNADFKDGYRSQFTPKPDDDGEWPSFLAVRRLADDRVEVDVDGAHPDIVRGAWVVLSQDATDFYRELYEVVDAAELSRSAFAVSGKVTRLVLRGEPHDFATPRDVTVYAVADPLALAEAPDDSPVTGTTVVVDGDASAMSAGRHLVLAGRTAGGLAQAEVVVLDSVVALPSGRTELRLTTAPPLPLVRAGAVVFGNVARATHGETVTQLLGSGDARRAFSSFPLAQGPLTHVRGDGPRGTESTLEVRVDGVRWAEQASAYTAGPEDRVHTTRDEPDGTVSVVFGDGARGARPPSGSHNLRATYRKGLGAGGNVGADTLSQAVDRPLGLKGVTNPAAAGGGVDPEPETHARASIPLPVRTLGRAVSLLDYADFARAYTGIGQASAVVLPLRAGRTVVVSVVDTDHRPPAPVVLDLLAGELRRSGDPHVLVEVVAARPATFRLSLSVRVHPDHTSTDVLAAVASRLREVYGPASRSLGEPVHRSAVVATAAGVPGVVAIDLDVLARGPSGLALRLLADPARTQTPGQGATLGVELLSLAETLPPDWVREMP